MQVTFKYWKLCDHSVCDEWIIESLKVISQLGRDIECLGVKEAPYWNFVAVDNFIYPILHNQINSGNFFHNLLDCGNKYIEKLLVDEDKARNSLLVIDSSIH